MTRLRTAVRFIRRGAGLTTTLWLTTLAFGAVSAQAGIGASATPTFPNDPPGSILTVGDTGRTATIEVGNSNTAPNAAGTNTVCNFGDPFPCPAGEPGITMIPSCGTLGAFSSCTVGNPGVFSVPSTATGVAGTACSGMTFDVTEIDPAFGTLRFTPQGGANVTLAGAGAVCRIGFSFDVLSVPTVDYDPNTPGVQTVQIVDNTQRGGSPETTASARGTTNPPPTVAKAAPTITTSATGSVVLGGQITDNATVAGRVTPVAGASIIFRAYGPDDATCSGTAAFESTVAYPVAGGSVTSGAYTPTAAGTYRWRATYTGDANNLAVTGACNAPNETSTVTTPGSPPPPPGAAPPPAPPPPPAAVSPQACTPRPGPAPAGGELCAPGSAQIAGRTGCQGSPFAIRVTGRQIAKVVYTLDGKQILTLRKRNSSGKYFRVVINPRPMKSGTHRVLARITFKAASGTKPRTLRVVFSRCARQAVAPKFTG